MRLKIDIRDYKYILNSEFNGGTAPHSDDTMFDNSIAFMSKTDAQSAADWVNSQFLLLKLSSSKSRLYKDI